MTTAKIMVVGDQNRVALDLEHTLTRLGYAVPAVAFSAEEALRKVAEIQLDLLVMDIVLKDCVEVVQNPYLGGSRQIWILRAKRRPCHPESSALHSCFRR